MSEHDGKAPFADILRAAKKAETPIPERTLRRARRKAGVLAERSGFQGGSIWRLPEGDAPSPEAVDDPVRPQSGQPSTGGRNGRNGRNEALAVTDRREGGEGA